MKRYDNIKKKGNHMDIIQIAKRIEESGGTLYLVGGVLRDRFFHMETQDEDYCVTGIEGKTFLSLFPEAKVRGKAFEVYELENREFAMARTEKKMGAGHTQFEITTGVSIQEDLKRRDITINAMAQNVLSGEIIDPFGGRQDLANKLIRKTSDAFCEDPLRVYRVARFAALLEFEVEKETIQAMKACEKELETLSVERVFQEFRKALGAQKPSIFFEVLKQANVLSIHFKEIQDLIGSLQPERFHPEGDSFAHTMQVLDLSSLVTKAKKPNERELEIRFSCLVHDLGKGVTPKKMQPHHYGHEEAGVILVENFGKRLKIPNRWIKCGKLAAREHMRGGIFEKMSVAKQVDFMVRVNKSLLGLEGLAIVVACDRAGRKADGEKWEIPNPKEVPFLTLGKQCFQQVKVKETMPGKQMGEKLREERIKWLKKRKEENK